MRPYEPPVYEPALHEPPIRQANRSNAWAKSGAVGAGAALLAFLAKFKTLLVLLLNFKWVFLLGKFALTFGTALLSVAVYAQAWGWAFAAGFVVLLFVHEMGHVLSIRAHGLPASAPIFIPFFGAMIAMQHLPPDAKVEAEIALAGPLLGTLGAAICFALAVTGGGGLWYALAYWGFFLNLLNMIPIIPLDGGRVIGALSPKLWALGMAILIVVALLLGPLAFVWIGLLVLLSLPRVIEAFKAGAADAPYYHVALADRWSIGLQYFGLAAFLALMLVVTGKSIHGGLTL